MMAAARAKVEQDLRRREQAMMRAEDMRTDELEARDRLRQRKQEAVERAARRERLTGAPQSLPSVAPQPPQPVEPSPQLVESLLSPPVAVTASASGTVELSSPRLALDLAR
jgi:hypothetical protein